MCIELRVTEEEIEHVYRIESDRGRERGRFKESQRKRERDQAVEKKEERLRSNSGEKGREIEIKQWKRRKVERHRAEKKETVIYEIVVSSSTQ